MNKPNLLSNSVFQKCVQLLTGTVCVVMVLLAMAADPSWDEIQKGIPASLLAGAATWIAGWFFKDRSGS